MSLITANATALSRGEVHRRGAKRRLSAPSQSQLTRLQICPPLPHSLEALDLSSVSPTQTLASLRFLILSYLADLERMLSELGSPDLGTWEAMGEMTIEEAKQWARTALEMLEGIRAEVCSHFPEFHFADISVENFVKSHFPDIPDVNEMRSHLPDMPDVRCHLPDMPHLPDIPDVRSRLSGMRTTLDDVRTRFHDIDFKRPLSYIPTLSDRLRRLHSHLSSLELPSGLDVPAFTPNSVIFDLLDTILHSDVLSEFTSTSPDILDEGHDLLERAAHEIKNAVKRSLEGVRLIQYSDLPHDWKNNPFVTQGYRLVPENATPRCRILTLNPQIYTLRKMAIDRLIYIRFSQ
jgi:adiponectin receptor